MNNDRMYSRSPADTAINNIYKERINHTEKRVLDRLSERSRTIYDMKECGTSFTDISKIINLHVSKVSRDYHRSVNQLKDEFLKVLGKEKCYE